MSWKFISKIRARGSLVGVGHTTLIRKRPTIRSANSHACSRSVKSTTYTVYSPARTVNVYCRMENSQSMASLQTEQLQEYLEIFLNSVEAQRLFLLSTSMQISSLSCVLKLNGGFRILPFEKRYDNIRAMFLKFR